MYQPEILKNMIKQFNNKHNQQSTTPKKIGHIKAAKSDTFQNFPLKMSLSKINRNSNNDELNTSGDFGMNMKRNSQIYANDNHMLVHYNQDNVQLKSSFRGKENNHYHENGVSQAGYLELNKRYSHQNRRSSKDYERNSRQNSIQKINASPSHSATKNHINTSQKKQKSNNFAILDRSYQKRKSSVSNTQQYSNKNSSRTNMMQSSGLNYYQQPPQPQQSQHQQQQLQQSLESENQILKYKLLESERNMKQQMKMRHSYQMNKELDLEYFQKKFRQFDTLQIQKRPIGNVVNLLSHATN